MFDAVPARPIIPLTQSAGFARAAALLGCAVEEVALGRSGHALMQVRWWPVPGWLGLISRGPLWTGRPDAGLLADRLRQTGHPVLVNAEVMPQDALRRAGFLKVMTEVTVARLDLAGGSAAIRARMHQKWRNRLRRGEDGPLQVARMPLPQDPHHWLLEAETAQRRARGYRGLPPGFALAYASANPGMAQVFEARFRGETVAGMLFLMHGPTATYFVGHADVAGRSMHAHALLLAEAASWLADQGTDALELGPIDTVNAPGLARFKLGSGAEAVRLGGTWLYDRRLARVLRR